MPGKEELLPMSLACGEHQERKEKRERTLTQPGQEAAWFLESEMLPTERESLKMDHSAFLHRRSDLVPGI